MSKEDAADFSDPSIYFTAIDQKMLDFWLELDSKGDFIHSPKNNEELWEFIRIAIGFEVPRKVMTEGHRAPFEFIADTYFERQRNILGFANRSGAKTTNVAIINFLNLLFKRGCEITSAGATKDQAKNAFSYMMAFMEHKWFKDFCKNYQNKTGRKFIVREIKEELSFANGAKQQIIISSDKGLRGPRSHKFVADEVDEWEMDKLETGLSISRSDPKNIKHRKKIKQQNILISTRQKMNGPMDTMIRDAKKKDFAVYEWNIWDVLEKCERKCQGDPVYGDCPIYKLCEGRAHDCEGFYPVQDFIDKARLLSKRKFEAEWLNKRPGNESLVYPMFERNTHVLDPITLHRLTGFQRPMYESWPIVSGIDFGASPGNPFVYLKLIQLPNHAWMVFHEYQVEQKLLWEHAAHIRKSPGYKRNEPIYADHDAQDRLELKNLKVRTEPAQKSVSTGLDFIAELFSGYPPSLKPMLYVWYECEDTIFALENYSWPKTHAGKVDRSGRPAHNNSHIPDALRYAMYSSKEKKPRQYRTYTLPGI